MVEVLCYSVTAEWIINYLVTGLLGNYLHVRMRGENTSICYLADGMDYRAIFYG